MKFKDLKQVILDRAKEQSACASEYKRALSSKNRGQLLKVIKDNFAFCYGSVVTVETLELFGETLCAKYQIYYKGYIAEIKGEDSVILCGDVKIGMLGSSTVQEMWDSSTVQKMWGSSTVRTWHKINPELKGSRFCIIDYSRNKVILGSDLTLEVI